MNEHAQLRGNVRASARERVDRRQLAVPFVVVDGLCEQCLEVRLRRHVGGNATTRLVLFSLQPPKNPFPDPP